MLSLAPADTCDDANQLFCSLIINKSMFVFSKIKLIVVAVLLLQRVISCKCQILILFSKPFITIHLNIQ